MKVPAQLRRAILNRSRTRERASVGLPPSTRAVAARCKWRISRRRRAAHLRAPAGGAGRALALAQRSTSPRDLQAHAHDEGQAQALIRAIACPVLSSPWRAGVPGSAGAVAASGDLFGQIEMVQVAGKSSLPYGKFGQNRRLYRKLLSDPVGSPASIMSGFAFSLTLLVVNLRNEK